MGNGSSSPKPLRIPVYLPSFRFFEIDRKKAELERLKNDINNLNWQINQEQATLDKRTSERNDWVNDVNEKIRMIEQLTNERDELIIQREKLKAELANLQESIDISNEQSNIIIPQNLVLANTYSETTIDTIKTKDELYNAIKIQNNLIEPNNTFRTNDSRVGYLIEQISFLSIVNISMLIIYFILTGIFGYIFYYFKPSVNIYVKMGYIIGLILFPFFIMQIEFLVYYFFQFVLTKLNLNGIFL